MGRPIRHKPNDLKNLHDRRATDFSIGISRHIVPIEVDDPYEPGTKIVTVRSTRNDPLGWLHSRKYIDEAQYRGGRQFQTDFEAAERGPRAIDPSKEAVDGGLMPEPITETQRKAALALKRAYRALGADGSALAHDVLIHSKSTESIAISRGLPGERWEKYFRMRFNECLDTIAFIYGFSREDSGRRRLEEKA